MRLSLFLILSILLITLIFSGCVTVQKETFQTQDLEPSTMLRFSDIPYPSGFKILPEKSFILESGRVRAGILRYTGRANIEDVFVFYKAQMSIYNWALLNVLEYGDRMLNFERENESCVVTIKPKGDRVEISVSLAPKSPIHIPEKKVKSEKRPRGEQEK